MMMDQSRAALKASSPYNAVMTREQFLFHEMRTTAQLITDGLNSDEVIARITEENLYQYPTERMIKTMARTCLRRLACLQDDTLVAAIASQPSAEAKQICLYAMMKQYRLMWDFMITVIGEKYRSLDLTFRKGDLNSFFSRLQEQDSWVAVWSDSTVTKLKAVIRHVLVENDFLENRNSEVLQPVLICPVLEKALREKGEDQALMAFNCF